MNIELADPKLVRITWQPYDSALEAEIAKRLNTVPGIEGQGRRWYAPAVQVARLIELFPKASFDYPALQACDVIALVFYDSLVALGVNFKIVESGAIVGLGDGVSPLLQQLIDDRAPALRSLVINRLKNPQPQRQVATPVSPEDEELYGPLFRGIQNAKRKADEEVKYPKRRRFSKKKEREL